jgi:beta-lactamase superfamily II metal-dependent hydrolase
MMRLHVIQARFGDCFLLEYGSGSESRFMLVDGGPARNYDEQLKPALAELMNGRREIEDVIVSHVDNDHIVGVLDLLSELQSQQDKGLQASFTIGQLWFNSFSQTIGTRDIESRIEQINRVAAMNSVKMEAMSMALNGIREGSRLLFRADKLHIPLNKDSQSGFYLASKNNVAIRRSNLELRVVGPTLQNLKNLQDEWEEWVQKNEIKIAQGKYTREVASALDRSVPNLSSIVILIEGDGRKILLTGDCRGDHLQQGLIETGIAPTGKIHVDVLKLPHHGSVRNASRRFFEEVTADVYIVSADGTYDNPDEETLDWIIGTAKDAARKIKLVFTNETVSTRAIHAKYDGVGYEVKYMDRGEHFLTIS